MLRPRLTKETKVQGLAFCGGCEPRREARTSVGTSSSVKHPESGDPYELIELASGFWPNFSLAGRVQVVLERRII